MRGCIFHVASAEMISMKAIQGRQQLVILKRDLLAKIHMMLSRQNSLFQELTK